MERTTKKGATVYQVTLCPETAPFTTRAAADEFMRGKAYQKAVKRELRAIRAARKGLREAELTDAQKARRDAKAARAKERRRRRPRPAKRRAPLGPQIAARKAVLKKKRRAERAAAASAKQLCDRFSGMRPRAAAGGAVEEPPSAPRFARPACGRCSSAAAIRHSTSAAVNAAARRA